MKSPINTAFLRGPQFYKFSDCYLDTLERRLFKNSKRLKVTPRVLEVLQVLIENAGEVVTKDELLDQIWGESFVEEGNLAVQISKLRTVLGATKDEPYIVTESGTGYKFVSRVRALDDDEWADLIDNELAQREGGKQKYTSIAVMPLLNESGDEDVEYLADGITESIINSLSSIPELRVIARNTVFQFKEDKIDVKKLGRRLRVATILTGRLRVVQGNLAIAVELAKVADGSHIWGTSLYEPLEDIFEIQEKISKEISRQLESRVGARVKPTPYPNENFDPESYRLLLKGIYFRRKGGSLNLSRSVENLQKSLLIDPSNPNVYLELADSYLWQLAYEMRPLAEVSTNVNRMIEKSESLHAQNSKLLYLKAQAKMRLEWELSLAKKFFEESLAINPNAVPCNFAYANLLVNLGSTQDALKIARKLMLLAPISVHNQRNASKLFYKAAEFEVALAILSESLELDPINYETFLLTAANLVELGRYGEAHEFLKAAEEIHDHFELQSLRGYAYAKSGNHKKANEIVHFLESQAHNQIKVPPIYTGIIYSELDKSSKAFERIEQSIRIKHMDILSLKVDPRFSRIRGDSRFRAFVSKIGLD